MAAGLGNGEPGRVAPFVCRTRRCNRPARGRFDAFPSGKILAGQRCRGSQQLRSGPLEHHAPAILAAAGSEIDDVVRRTDDGGLVLDDHDGVADVTQPFEDTDHAGRVARVQANRRFIEHEQGVDQAGAEAGCEVDALGFAPGKSPCRAVQGEVTKTDLDQVAESGADFAQRKPQGVGGLGADTRDQFVGDDQRVLNREGIKVGKGEARFGRGNPGLGASRVGGRSGKNGAGRHSDAVEQSLGRETTSAAVRTGTVAPVAGQGRRGRASCRAFDSSQRKNPRTPYQARGHSCSGSVP